MNFNMVLPCVLLLMQVVGSVPLIKKQSRIYEKKDGWSIPFPSYSHPIQIKHQSEIMVEGKRIRITSFKIEDNPVDNSPRVIKLPIMDDSGDIPVIAEQNVFINAISQMDIEGKIFCYLVRVSPVYGGNSAGVEYIYAYYDESGDGLFRKRELINPHPGDGVLFRLPEWMKGVAQGQ